LLIFGEPLGSGALNMLGLCLMEQLQMDKNYALKVDSCVKSCEKSKPEVKTPKK
jgi:hypothetical protein